MTTFRLRSDSPWSWVIAVLALILVVALAVVFFTAFLVLLGVGVVAAPFLRWKQRRAAARAPDRSPGKGKVIDVDYEVRDS